MDLVKNWYQSKTIWGALIAVAASALQLAGLGLGQLTRRNWPISRSR